MSPARIEWSLEDAIRQPGCPICRVLREDERGYWEFFLYEGFQDPDADARLFQSIGYCHRHLAQLAARNDVFAAASLALASIEGALSRVERARLRRGNGFPRAGDGCPVCANLAGSEESALQALVPLLERDADLAAAYGGSDGLCYEHLGVAVAIHGRRARELLVHAQERLSAHRDALVALVNSFDYRSAPADVELSGAWSRAFRALRDNPGRIGSRSAQNPSRPARRRWPMLRGLIARKQTRGG
jgi:hypothetical protein